MRGGVTFSALLHLAVLVVMVIGLPDFGRDLEISPPIPVEIATIDDITRPKPVEKPQPKVEQPEEPQEIPEAPKPPPQEAAPAPPPPPEPVKQVARAVEPPAPEPEPEPEPEPLPLPPEPKVEPEPEPEPEKVEKPEPEPQAPRPDRKPRPKKKAEKKKPEKKKPKPEPDRLAAILKNVEQLQDDKPPQRKQTEEAPQPQQTTTLSSLPMTISEIDAVKQQIWPCWNPNIGAPNAEDLVVEIRVLLNQDGSLQRALVANGGSLSRNSYLRDAEERALRAVKRCTPLQRLPPKKYSVWRDMTLVFDPSEILGQ